MNISSVAIVGNGQFGTFMAEWLAPYLEVRLLGRADDVSVVRKVDAVIFAVPFGALPTAIATVKPNVRPETLIMDVTSIKVAPLQLLQEAFPTHQIIVTHPIFGPQSGKNGIAGLPIVVTNVSATAEVYTAICAFLRDTLALRVVEQSADQHDRDMADIQALTHLIGRTLIRLDIKSHDTDTRSYEQLLELCNLLRFDSFELFETIQNGNPHAKAVRDAFRAELDALEEELVRKD
jgi:prephenate dehydrogenase